MNINEDKERRFWELRNKIYSLFLENFIPYRELIGTIIEKLNPVPEFYILDAGCGPGIFEKIIIGKEILDLKIEAIDISKEIINIAKKKNRFSNNVSFKIVDLNDKLKYRDQSFDAVVCINVLYLLQKPRDTLIDFFRVLKEGGKLMISIPKYNFNYSPLLQRHFLRVNGIKKIRDIILFFFILVLIFFFEFIITKRERRGRYHRFNKSDILRLFQGTNFRNLEISDCYAGQNFLIIAEK